MKDEVTKVRDKFMEDAQKLGFPVKVQGGKALRQRNQEPLSEQPTESTTFGPGGFMMRKPGMPFEEFKKACIKSLTEKGLFKHFEQRKAERERLAKEQSSLQVMSEEEEKRFVQYLKDRQQQGPIGDEYIIKKPRSSKE